MSGANPSPAAGQPAGPDLAALKAKVVRFKRILFGIALVSVLLRIWMSVQVVRTDPFAYNPPDVTDMATYHALSRGILNGVFPMEYVYQPFYYTVFLPAAKLLSGSE